VQLADAVAASSAFPPMLSPFEIDLRGQAWRTVAGNDLAGDQWRGEIKLSDGGVYDNLGLETVWKRYKTVLISDGGGHVADDVDPSSNWPQQVERVLMVVDNQVRSLRKRQAIGSFKLGLRTGAYWGIRADVKDYDLADHLKADPDLTRALAQMPTRLKKVDSQRQEQLINWGYVICDTALRRWVARDKPKPDQVPYPNSPIG
jgi:NTE family protein